MNSFTAVDHFVPTTVLVTGGAGFIGSNLVRYLLTTVPTVHVVNLDLLTYAGNLESLSDVETQFGNGGDGRYQFVRGDIRDASLVSSLLDGNRSDVWGRSIPPVDAILHLAAESHVDRSIVGPDEFISTNVLGTHTLVRAVQTSLEQRPRPFRFVNVSTDEVYGSLGPTDHAFTEKTPLAPNSPYSASKASADCLVRAYYETFGTPCITTRCSNNYGPFQFPEKLIPLMVTRAMAGEPLPVYGDGLNVRDWLHVTDHASAIWSACTCGRPGQVYNVGGNCERANIEVVHAVLEHLGQPTSLIRYVTDRKGHDRRYAIDSTKAMEDLEWSPRYTFEAGLRETVQWYRTTRVWWERVISEAYRVANVVYLRSPLNV